MMKLGSVVRGLALAAGGTMLMGMSPIQDAPIPTVTFRHVGLIENYCATWSPVKPDPAVVAELSDRLPEFEAAWERDGPGLMLDTVSIVGEPYRFSETLAVLHACPDLSSMSMPLLIAAARYTEAAGAGAESGLVVRAAREGRLPDQVLPPRPLSDFTATVFHEVQHRYVRDLIDRYPHSQTPIMLKYAEDSAITRNHIHLFAIESAVHAARGTLAIYDDELRRYVEGEYQDYVRAFEIVEHEGAEAIIAELRSEASP